MNKISIKQSPLSNLILALLSGLFLFLAWPDSPLTGFIFIAFIPLLWVEYRTPRRSHFFWLCYLTMFIWNISTTWWIWNASLPGALGAFFANSFLMCLPWFGFRTVKKKFGEVLGYTSLIVFWIGFEYVHLQDWGLSWPWLTLGNAFASHPEWIQWYEFTGTGGGTLWIMAVNVFIFLHLKNSPYSITGKYRHLLSGLIILMIPLIISLEMNNDEGSNSSESGNVVVVQPNIDPYEKISASGFSQQLEILISLTEDNIDSNTRLVIWPETALYTPSGLEEDSIGTIHELQPLRDLLAKFPQVSVFTGVESYRAYDHQATPTARGTSNPNFFYDAYNGSVMLHHGGAVGFYHKSMLVPGVETLPWFLKFIDAWFEKFGGTTAGYAKQDERTVLADATSTYRIAPAICYESIYGEFMARYIRNGANMIAIITNDGWWGNSPGHRQHMNYARLRAIESRKWVARSANTGISCFIDPYGNIPVSLDWDTRGAIKFAARPIEGETFFVRFGDLISRIATLASIVMVLITLIFKFRELAKRKNP